MRKTTIPFVALWALTSLYIALFPTRHYTADAVNNLVFIEQQNRFELWHTQHLLAQWPGYWTYQLAGGRLRAWEAMRIAHALLAGAAVSLVYAAVFVLTRAPRIAIAGGLFLWFSYGFWHYQSDPDVYSAGYAAVALLLFAYVYYLDAPGTGRAWLLALAAALAILMHQLNVELAGLIGLSLIVLMKNPHPPTPSPLRREGEEDTPSTAFKFPLHAMGRGFRGGGILLYAAVCVLIPLAAYLVGWRDASAYLAQLGGTTPGFAQWASGYFRTAQAGEATWGVSFGLNTLPAAAYTFLLSWILPPNFEALSAVEIALLALLGVGVVGLAAHIVVVLRRLPIRQRMVAWVCALALLANSISGWWWQAGNMKFYLFMQIPLIILGALYACQPLVGRQLHLRRIAVALVMGIVVLFHAAFTLPYETRGGVFTVAELAGDTPVWFDQREQATIFRYITPHSGRRLPADFCQNPPRMSGRAWWVVREDMSCPILANASVIGRYQADRSRRWWVIYELKQMGIR